MEDRPERGEGGIRTPDAGFTDITVFETAAFNRSATSPPTSLYTHSQLFNHYHPLVVHLMPHKTLNLLYKPKKSLPDIRQSQYHRFHAVFMP